MPKQIFQRPAPVRHDHFAKKQRSGPPVPKAGKPLVKPPVPPAEKPAVPAGPALKLPK